MAIRDLGHEAVLAHRIAGGHVTDNRTARRRS